MAEFNEEQFRKEIEKEIKRQFEKEIKPKLKKEMENEVKGLFDQILDDLERDINLGRMAMFYSNCTQSGREICKQDLRKEIIIELLRKGYLKDNIINLDFDF